MQKPSAMVATEAKLRHFKIDLTDTGVAVVTIDRPPVNAFSFEVYEDFHVLLDILENTEEIRVVVLTAQPDAKAFSAGADLHDFLKLDYESRLRRFEVLGAWRHRFYHLNRPIIAALNSHAIGVGFTTATLCDIRVASEDAFFQLPEIDRGVSMGAGVLVRQHVAQGLIREMVLTGRRFTARELEHSGLFQYVLPKAQVLPKAMEIAENIAKKSVRAVRMTKTNLNLCETILDWEQSSKMTAEASARLTAGTDSKEGIRAFLEKRAPSYSEGAE
ncbi:MAG TPA: enoyl-CoA hydratase-related protein [Devosiaceae bacterium]